MFDEVVSNKRRSWVLTIGFALFVALVAAAAIYLVGYGGPYVVIAAVVISIGSSVVAYWTSDKVALRVSRARPASVEEFPQLHNIVEGLCLAAGMPKPRLYVVDDPAPNAFATGRNPEHAAVAATTGLLEKMNRDELEGVLAHELSHVRNYDILVSTLAVTMVGVVVVLADLAVRMQWWGMGRNTHRDYDQNRGGNDGGLGIIIAILGFLLLALAPLIAQLLQFAVGRRRETLADVSGVELTRYPQGLISALEKLRDDSTVVHATTHATAHLWIEEPAAQTPAAGKISWINRMFSTHPPIDERIALLRGM
ncbi:M48 family metallopeptidase [Nocardia sp. NPDC051030]|uniref:M48 family metallopeptidase n=1 Tax=Nocardia sp. NPDC051030 TaxID=3155162 RepID=UPI00341C948B